MLLSKVMVMGGNAALMLLLANLMEIETFGLLVTLISAQLLLSRVLMLGVDAGVIRLPTMTGHTAGDLVRAALVVIGWMSALVATVCLAGGVLLSMNPVAGLPAWLLVPIFVGAVGTALVDLMYSFWLAQLRYASAAVVQGGTAVVRFALTIVAALVFPEHPLVVFFAYPMVSLLAGLAHLLSLKSEHGGHSERGLVRRLLRFSSWVGSANVVVILSLYQGVFLLTLLDKKAAAGLFGLGLTLSMGFFALFNVYQEYLLPRIARVEDRGQLRRFLTGAGTGALVLIVGCLPVVFILDLVVVRFLRPDLHAVTGVFHVLAASMLCLLFQAPLEALCHYLLKTHLLIIGWALRVVVAAVVGMILVSEGALGIATAQLWGAIVSVLAFVTMLAFAFRSSSLLLAGQCAATAVPEGKSSL